MTLTGKEDTDKMASFEDEDVEESVWKSNSTCSDPWETVNLYKREDLSQVHHHHYPHHQPHLLTIVLVISSVST